MKPGRRRLLIPGLLIALLVVVAVAAATRRADADTPLVPIVDHTQVSTIDDPRVAESSGLAASQAHPGIAYTMNDSGDAARVFAINIASGRVVGVTTIRNAVWNDAEAMALRDGKLWVADIGSNRPKGAERALYAFDEPGSGNHQVSADRYPVEFPKAALEAESIVVLPNRMAIVTKSWPQSVVLQLKLPLVKDKPNVAQATGLTGPAWATDATATADGKYVLIHGVATVEVHDTQTWAVRHIDVIPMLQQGESITVESTGTSYLIGSEGEGSPLVRIAFRPATFTTPPPTIDAYAQARDQQPIRALVWDHSVLIHRAWPVAAGGALLLLVLVVWLVVRRRRRSRRST